MSRAVITKTFRQLASRHNPATLFGDFCEAVAIALSNPVDLQHAEQREARYLDIMRAYKKHPDVIAAFPQLFGDLILALETGLDDVLGGVFHDLELHNTYKGQFFTPFPVCQLMARAMTGDARNLIEQKGVIQACEPACGSRAMIIALADALAEQEINYQQHLHVTAIDIDPRAVHMAYIQLSLLHIPAIVVRGNSLTLEEVEHWYTPAHILGGWSRKLRNSTPHPPGAAKIMPMARPQRPTAPETADQNLQKPEPRSLPKQLSLF